MGTKRLLLAMIFATAGLLLPEISHADAIAVSVASPASVSQGDAFTVDVDIANAADIFDFEFDLNFDPTVLQASDVVEGTFLSGGGSTFFLPGFIDNTAGSVSFNADTLLSAISGVDGSGLLLQFDFNALAPGSSALDISNLLLQDSLGNLLDSSAQSSSVTVTGVPVSAVEPDSLALLTIGVAACLAFSIRRMRSGLLERAG